MRVGLMLPGVVAPPRATAAWEREITPDQLITAAGLADDAGYSHLGCSEHIAVSRAQAETEGGVYWDPATTLAYIAAGTVRIRLLTQVIVLGFHHPLAIAKRYGTLDRLSTGRVILGVGVDTPEPEFTLLGASYADRAERADDAMRAIRAAWGRRYPVYHGTHYHFDDVELAPTAVREMLSIWVEGASQRSLARAVELGDGWMPRGRTLEEYRQLLVAVPPPEGFEVVLPVLGFLDPQGDPDRTRAALEAVRGAGATVASITLVAHTFEQWCDQVSTLAELGERWELDFSDPRAELL